MCHGGVVDRQYLYGFLAGKYSPVYHLFQVAKVTYSEALFGAQREDGHGYPAPFQSGRAK